MKTMTNVDIYAITHELNNLLKGSRVEKSYQPTKNIVVMKFHKAGYGRIDIVMEAGKRIHQTQYPIKNPTQPPSFPMLLRKKLSGANVVSVKQHGFDRIVEITMQKEQKYSLIIELFSKGNIILLDEEKNIIMPLKRKSWSNRDISSNKEYKYPPENTINPLTIKEEELKELLNNSEDDLIRTLAKNGLGSLYAEEILLRTNILRKNKNLDEIDKKINPNDLSNSDIDDIYESFKLIFEPLKEGKIKPEIVNGKKEDVVPIELEKYHDFKHEYFENFNKACDEFYSKKINETISNEEEKIWNKRVGKYEKRLKLQEETLQGFHETIKKSQKKGELIYSNYTEIESLINVIEAARDKDYSYKEINKRLKKAKKDGLKATKNFVSLDKMGAMTVEFDNIQINIDTRKKINENAETYYEKAKKAKHKIKGANIAIENTKKQLKQMQDKKEIATKNITTIKKRVKKELKWFEKFRWFISSTGVLVIGGRDANSNENIVKKHLDNNDIYMHADIHGAPSIAVKLQGKEIDEQTLKESAIFTASFSSAWKDGYSTQDVYWVEPDQVSKSPESGEFLPKGSFVIRGHRNYVHSAQLKIAIGIVDYEGKRVMAGPEDAVKAKTNKYVLIKPGFTKKEAMAKSILSKINEDNILDLDDIVKVLPTGKCDYY